MNKRDMAIHALFLSAIVLLVSFVAVGMMGHAYQLGLQEGMELNKERPVAEATVYWYKNGELAYAEHNVMCYLGLNDTANLLGDDGWVNSNATTHAFKWIAIGTGSGGGATSLTLATEFARASGTFAEVASVNGNWTITYTWTAGSFSGQTITEAGCVNAASGGIFLNYQDFAGITLTVSDSLEVEFMFQAS